ncbi:nucleoside triphosphate pyrophosphohydrolase [Actinobacillus succinogenes]|uniref:Nucleoside triphosphate pyrophosphohydrolase n=1 Tax=Actinobacillus succinogenes (strain ATCC 55618 / DSM 22257 / CCUG 43843 / 130Z) TaxID=339671 RepID=A6VKD8_ACTSZ|nr:nucleoside triphosphate pyrophosphohydrolase [Actinobacillus succinogenes]ABR73435.1 MazG family protein [Actinobacillus succinogenes 130Z]PHI40102.1 nucleoside triphosphate pyrophosphohydrolase [Actinobacillus succinogenes]
MAYHIQDFVRLIARLRNPNGGCPWDLKQNYQTMIPCLIEESYEVIDAIERQDTENLREELGDLLMQVVFLSQLATEEQKFTFDDVVNDVAEKIVRRHPHVFGEQSAGNEQEALAHWNAIKAQEKSRQKETSILDGIPHAFPALLRAEKLQKKCSKVGFDWNDVNGVIAKVEEELDEVKQELNRPHLTQTKVNEEMGDLLFAAVNLARHVKTQPEEALRQANHKFERRFRTVEQKIRQSGKALKDCSLAELDQLWDEVKSQE